LDHTATIVAVDLLRCVDAEIAWWVDVPLWSIWKLAKDSTV
jgi:hypothetical protein